MKEEEHEIRSEKLDREMRFRPSFHFVGMYLLTVP